MSSTWNLIYATNAAGGHVGGSLSDFRKAVMAGADVKVIYSPQAGAWWSRNLSSVNVTGSGGTTVIAGTYMEAADTNPAPGGGITFEKNPFALEYQIYNTTGVRFVMKFDYETHRQIQDTSNTVPMRWYVKDYEFQWWPWVENADAISAILEGWAVK